MALKDAENSPNCAGTGIADCARTPRPGTAFLKNEPPQQSSSIIEIERA